MEEERLQIFESNKTNTVMSTIVKILILLFVNSTFANAQDVNLQDITVNISGLESSEGKLLIGLYSSEESFLDKRFKSIISEISKKTGKVIFKDIPNGTYAISFIHDENDNGKMDTNFLGVPKESYGCSNNAKGFMGPPKWKDAKFELNGQDKIIDIKL